MTTGDTVLLATGVSLVGVFAHRILARVDAVYDAVCGTTEKPGVISRLEALERAVGIQVERRQGERRGARD